MAAVGIVAEYNPFHNGHLFHISETKKRFPDRAIVCVMSGNFVQRGEPALLHKTVRAAMAVEGGADLVFELPVPFANAPAEIFAQRAIALLAATGVVSALSFGSECGDIEELKRAADDASFDRARFAALMAKGCSYAFARANALPEDRRETASAPNNLLAIEYIRAAACLLPDAALFTVARKGAGHDSAEADADVLSASKLRSILRENGAVDPFVPPRTAELIRQTTADGRCPVSLDALSLPILAALRRVSAAELAGLPEVSEGMEHRLLSAAAQATALEPLLELLKTRRYTKARLRRILISAYLGLTKSEQMLAPQYLRLLAASGRGTALLKTMKQAAKLPVITKPAAIKALAGDAETLYAAEVRADALYALAYPNSAKRAEDRFFYTTPYIAEP